MEARGKVNMYAGPCPHRILTVNLHSGVTPFTIVCPDCKDHERGKLVPGRSSGHSVQMEVGILYSSFYKLILIPNVKVMEITIKQGWYRPGPTEFATSDPSTQKHVLNGGLLHKPLEQIADMSNDNIEPNMGYEKFQEFCLSYYGKRLP